jgi:hypothetical protein
MYISKKYRTTHWSSPHHKYRTGGDGWFRKKAFVLQDIAVFVGVERCIRQIMQAQKAFTYTT